MDFINKGLNFYETFSPMVKPTTIKVILSLALTFKWKFNK